MQKLTNLIGAGIPLERVKLGASERHAIHMLVYTVFKGSIPEGMTIDHLDGNPLNNHIDNFDLCSVEENNKRMHERRKRNSTESQPVPDDSMIYQFRAVTTGRGKWKYVNYINNLTGEYL